MGSQSKHRSNNALANHATHQQHPRAFCDRSCGGIVGLSLALIIGAIVVMGLLMLLGDYLGSGKILKRLNARRANPDNEHREAEEGTLRVERQKDGSELAQPPKAFLAPPGGLPSSPTTGPRERSRPTEHEEAAAAAFRPLAIFSTLFPELPRTRVDDKWEGQTMSLPTVEKEDNESPREAEAVERAGDPHSSKIAENI